MHVAPGRKYARRAIGGIRRRRSGKGRAVRPTLLQSPTANRRSGRLADLMSRLPDRRTMFLVVGGGHVGCSGRLRRSRGSNLRCCTGGRACAGGANAGNGHFLSPPGLVRHVYTPQLNAGWWLSERGGFISDCRDYGYAIMKAEKHHYKPTGPYVPGPGSMPLPFRIDCTAGPTRY
jgi:hypothetical protein